MFKHLQYDKIDWKHLVEFAYERDLKVEFDILHKKYYDDDNRLIKVEPFDIIYLKDKDNIVHYYITDYELKDDII